MEPSLPTSAVSQSLKARPRIVVDAMGGDQAPSVPVAGALAVAAEGAYEIILVGPVAVVQQELNRQLDATGRPRSSAMADALPPGLRLVDAPEVIGMADHPVTAVRSKRASSIVVGLDLVHRGEADAFVTAGNTGAAMAAAVLQLKRIEGIDRPALATPFPTVNGVCLLLDVGANADARAHNLVQFGLMGAIYAERVLGISSPRVALLSIGEEESKGNLIVQEAHRQMRAAPIHFIGNIEGKDISRGEADVVVMDGFVGNILVKFAEGVGATVLDVIRTELRSDLLSRLFAFALMPAFRRVRQRVDYADYGGAPLLGVNGICIVAHGRSTPRALASALRLGGDAVRGAVVDRIRHGLATAPSPPTSEPGAT